MEACSCIRLTDHSAIVIDFLDWRSITHGGTRTRACPVSIRTRTTDHNPIDLRRPRSMHALADAGSMIDLTAYMCDDDGHD
jgi:hypothetical protein